MVGQAFVEAAGGLSFGRRYSSRAYPHALKPRQGPQGPKSSQRPQRFDGAELRIAQSVRYEADQGHLRDGREMKGQHFHTVSLYVWTVWLISQYTYVYNEEIEPAPSVGEVLDEAVRHPLQEHFQDEDVSEDLVCVLQYCLDGPPLLNINILKCLHIMDLSSLNLRFSNWKDKLPGWIQVKKQRICLIRSRWNQEVRKTHMRRSNSDSPVLRCWAGSWIWWKIQTSCAPLWWSRFSWDSTSSWSWLPPRWPDSTGTCARSLQVWGRKIRNGSHKALPFQQVFDFQLLWGDLSLSTFSSQKQWGNFSAPGSRRQCCFAFWTTSTAASAPDVFAEVCNWCCTFLSVELNMCCEMSGPLWNCFAFLMSFVRILFTRGVSDKMPGYIRNHRSPSDSFSACLTEHLCSLSLSSEYWRLALSTSS